MDEEKALIRFFYFVSVRVLIEIIKCVRDWERDKFHLVAFVECTLSLSLSLTLLHIIPAAATCVFVERFPSLISLHIAPVVEMTLWWIKASSKKILRDAELERERERVRETSIYAHSSSAFHSGTFLCLDVRAICTQLDGSKWSLTRSDSYVCISTYRSYSKHPLNL